MRRPASACPESIGIGKGTVVLDDFETADAIFVIGRNPGANSPRMMTPLREASRRGVPIVAMNPLRERALERFAAPQDPIEMATFGSTRSLLLGCQTIATPYPPRLPDDVDERLGELETSIAAFEKRPLRYDPKEIARAGVFVSLGGDGEMEIERGFVRLEDQPTAEVRSEEEDVGNGNSPEAQRSAAAHQPEITVNGRQATAAAEPEPEEDDALRPLSDRLVSELTAHRTLALRDAVAGNFDVALAAVLHVLALDAFYRSASSSCLEINVKNVGFGAQAPGLKDTASAKAIDARHAEWRKHLPKRPECQAPSWNENMKRFSDLASDR